MTAIKTVTLIDDQEQDIVILSTTSLITEGLCAMVVKKMLDTRIVTMSGLVTVSFFFYIIACVGRNLISKNLQLYHYLNLAVIRHDELIKFGYELLDCSFNTCAMVSEPLGCSSK